MIFRRQLEGFSDSSSASSNGAPSSEGGGGGGVGEEVDGAAAAAVAVAVDGAEEGAEVVGTVEADADEGAVEKVRTAAPTASARVVAIHVFVCVALLFEELAVSWRWDCAFARDRPVGMSACCRLRSAS